MATKQLTPAEALAKAQELCAASEQCEYDIRTKLVRWGIRRADADTIIDTLTDGKYIDDTRYAAAYVRDKLNHARWGCRKIMAGLAAKRIGRRVASDAIAAEFDEDRYRDALLRLIAAKARGMERPLSRDDRIRLARFAVSRGFETGLIVETIRTIASSSDIR